MYLNMKQTAYTVKLGSGASDSELTAIINPNYIVAMTIVGHLWTIFTHILGPPLKCSTFGETTSITNKT